jgi:ATPase family associated with various cellular activities (AAA)
MQRHRWWCLSQCTWQRYVDGSTAAAALHEFRTLNLRCICAADEIDAIGTKRYEATSGGEREIQRTMLELLNQLDGFDSMGDVKVHLLSTSCCCSLLLQPEMSAISSAPCWSRSTSWSALTPWATP